MERSDAHYRALRGWEVGLRGGYDQVYGRDSKLPVFGMMYVSWNIGTLFQRQHDEVALGAHRQWVQASDQRVLERMTALRLRADALWRGERDELEELTRQALVLTERLGPLAAVEGDRARDYADSLRVELIAVDARRAYLGSHLRELAARFGDRDAHE